MRSQLLVGLLVSLYLGIGVQAQGVSEERIPEVASEARRSKSAPLFQLSPQPVAPKASRTIRNFTKVLPFRSRGQSSAEPDAIRQGTSQTLPSALSTPSPALSFEGVSDDDNLTTSGYTVVPPDTEGDVGPGHYVQMNNISFKIFDKQGNVLVGPLPNNVFWQGLEGVCAELNQGDPVVLYDRLADRWVFSQLALGEFSSIAGEASGHQCFAVSQTGDPTGAYWVYDFIVSPCKNPLFGGCWQHFGINDYPKLSVWPDGYYLTANEFQCDVLSGLCEYPGVRVAVFERSRMLNGQQARILRFNPLPENFSMQPVHLEGSQAPPPGQSNLLVQIYDAESFGGPGPVDGYEVWEVSVNWGNTSQSSLSQIAFVESPPFDANLCNFGNCIPQPLVTERLDALSQFTMFRAPYRNFGSYETLLVNHSVDADGNDTAGIRWTELRNTGSGWGLYQTGTYAPEDGNHRWLGSAAMDGSGNIALSYALSGESQFPSIAYTSRTPSDPPGMMAGGESICHFGSGSQDNAPYLAEGVGRWGDYSTISVDPSDDCTFWLTNEYYAETTGFDFKTRICAFRLANCTGDPVCLDNDGDGFSALSCGGTDCNDSNNGVFPGASELCADVVDNDCDGLVDSADPDCASTCTVTENPESSCSDGQDNDCDGSVDGADSNCSSGCIPTASREKGRQCRDGLDNDCDGFADSADTDCGTDSGGGGCSKKENKPQCSDGLDNDCDGLVDAADPDCQ